MGGGYTGIYWSEHSWAVHLIQEHSYKSCLNFKVFYLKVYAVLWFLQASFKKIETCKKREQIISVLLDGLSQSEPILQLPLRQEIKRYGHHRCPLMDSPNHHFLFSKHLNHSFDWVFCFSVVFFYVKCEWNHTVCIPFCQDFGSPVSLRFIHVAWSSNLLIVIVLS